MDDTSPKEDASHDRNASDTPESTQPKILSEDPPSGTPKETQNVQNGTTAKTTSKIERTLKFYGLERLKHPDRPKFEKSQSMHTFSKKSRLYEEPAPTEAEPTRTTSKTTSNTKEKPYTILQPALPYQLKKPSSFGNENQLKEVAEAYLFVKNDQLIFSIRMTKRMFLYGSNFLLEIQERSEYPSI